MEILGDLKLFFLGVINHWFSLMAGIGSLFLTFWEKIKNKPMAVRSLYALAVLLIFTSFFYAWRDQHILVVDYSVKLEKIQKYKQIRENLGKFLNEATSIQLSCEGVQSLPPEKTVYNKFADWNARLHKYLNENLDSSYAARLEDTGGMIVPIPSREMPQSNLLVWGYMFVRKEKLKEFIKEHQTN